MKPNRSVIIIIGVSRGLGRAMIAEFIGEGWIVLGCAANKNSDSL